MDSQALLESIVELHRYVGIEKSFFSTNDEDFEVSEVNLDAESYRLVSRINEFENFVVNGQDSEPEQPVFSIGDTISFKYRLPRNPRIIYESYDELVRLHRPLQKGELPNGFYIKNEDYLYLTHEHNEDTNIEKLINVSKLINFLEATLPHTENTSEQQNPKFVLFSREPNSKKLRKNTFESRYSFSDLPDDLPGLNFFLSIKDDEGLHSYEQIIILQNSLAELLSGAEDGKEFVFLLKNFRKLSELYKNNYETYINNFHLESFKKEVVDDYQKFSDDIDKKINDLFLKFFSVPAVSTATLFIRTPDDTSKTALTALVIISVLIIVFIHLRWVMSGLCLTENNIKEIFGKFADKRESGAIFANQKKKELLKKIEQAACNSYFFMLLVTTLGVAAIFLS